MVERQSSADAGMWVGFGMTVTTVVRDWVSVVVVVLKSSTVLEIEGDSIKCA